MVSAADLPKTGLCPFGFWYQHIGRRDRGLFGSERGAMLQTLIWWTKTETVIHGSVRPYKRFCLSVGKLTGKVLKCVTANPVPK